MKILLKNSFVVAGCALLFSFAPAAADNLLVNGDFEEVADGMPLAWEAQMTGAGEQDEVETTGEVRADDTRASSGSYCVYVRSDGPRLANAVQEVKLQTGSKYRLKAQVLSPTKNANVGIAVRGWLRGSNERFTASQRLPAGEFTEWTPLELEFVTPDNMGGASIYLRVMFNKVPVEAWFDDVSLELIE